MSSTPHPINRRGFSSLRDNTHRKYIHLPKPTQEANGLHFSMPSANPPFSALGQVVKLTFHGQIPAWSLPTYVSLSAG